MGDRNNPNAKMFPGVENKNKRFRVTTKSTPLNISHYRMETFTMKTNIAFHIAL